MGPSLVLYGIRAPTLYISLRLKPVNILCIPIRNNMFMVLENRTLQELLTIIFLMKTLHSTAVLCGIVTSTAA